MTSSRRPSVMAPLEINPQMIMWDPETYDVSGWDDVVGTGAVINIFAGGYYPEWLVGAGLVDEGQLDPSYDGSQARFIGEGGAIMQQGLRHPGAVQLREHLRLNGASRWRPC